MDRLDPRTPPGRAARAGPPLLAAALLAFAGAPFSLVGATPSPRPLGERLREAPSRETSLVQEREDGAAAEREEPEAPAAASREARAIEAIRAGRHAEAREILGEILVSHHLEEARRLLDEGLPEEALLDVDRALEIQPRNREVRFLQGRGQLDLAEKGMAAGRPGFFVEGALRDALAAFRAAGERADALAGASRAALWLGSTREALDLARRAVAARRDQGGAPGEEELGPLARAAYRAYVESRSAGERSEEAASLYAEAEEALGRLVGRTPEDPWVWNTLSLLQEWEERLADARATVRRGLDRVPDDPGLLARLDELARREGGAAKAVQVLGDFRERHPSIAGAWLREARARFETALAAFSEGSFEPDPFRVAEGRFRRARDLDPALSTEAIGWEVVCRGAVGWCLFNRGDLEGAAEAFLSMEEHAPGGIHWKYEDPTGGTELPSGVVGLEFVGARYYEREDWLAAAEVNARLHELVPDEPKFANNAGLFFRDAAVEIELEGRSLCRAARSLVEGEDALAALHEAAGVDPSLAGTPRSRRLLARAADERMERARALMERSRDAYMDAARLAPVDVRIVNDAALVLVYHLHEDLERAEEMLHSAVEMGTEQLEDEDLDEEARWELRNAWGDAHQNLGVLVASFRDDAEEALRWFERAAEIGPEPRPAVEEFWIPHLRGEREASEHDQILAARTWAEPCEHAEADR